MYFDLNRTKSPHRKNRHVIIALASLVLVSSAVAIPVPSMGAKGKIAESPAAPEAGVELLESILHRIGNDIQVANALKKNANNATQIAMAPPAEADALAPLQQQAGFDQMIDPRYVIRPKQRAEKASAKRAQIEGIKIAAAPASTEYGGRRYMTNAGGPIGGKYADQDMGASSALESIGGGSRSGGAGGAAVGGANRGMSPQNAERLGRDLGKLSGILNKMNTMQQQSQSVQSVPWGKSISSPGDNFYMGSGAPGAANIKEIVPTSASRPVQISRSNNVFDYRQQTPAESKKFEENRIASAPAAPSASLAGGSFAADDESGDTATMTLDKPKSWRNDQVMKEYAPEPLQEKAKDKSSVAGTKSLLDLKSPVSGRLRGKQIIAQRPEQIVFVPPSLAAGIPQLKLGATTSEASAFMSTHGKFKSKTVNGWTVWTLTNQSTGKTDLQIFVRRGTVEGLRIFNPTFVPDRLGVNISGTIKDVKEKFGEYAFWVSEPSADKAKNIRNYVYPVNQVSFQIARSGSKSGQPTVQSLLMFKFL